PFLNENVPVFSALPQEKKQDAIAFLTRELEVYEGMRAEKLSLRDSPKLLWRMLNRLGLAPLPDVFDKIENEDSIEVYLIDSTGHHQVFRNLKWFEHISFTIEQLASADWRLSASREEKYLRQLNQIISDLMAGKYESSFVPDVDDHELIEVDSPDLNHY